MRRFLFSQFRFLRVGLSLLLAVCGTGASLFSQQTEGIVFCAYNLRNYLKMERFVDGERTEGVGKPEHEIETVVRILTEITPDILGLCEIGTEEDVRDLQGRLRQAGLDLPHTELTHGGDTARGLALLSRLPLVARQSKTDLSYRIGEMTLPMQRGILDVTVQLREGLDLRLLGVHLKSKRPVPEADEALMRRNEAHLLRQHIEAILTAEPQTKLLAYGDFNSQRNEAALVEVSGAPGHDLSMMDIRLRDDRGESWTHYWEAADLYSRLDYVFVNRALQTYVDKEASHVNSSPDFYQASDHRPLVVKIDLAKDKRVSSPRRREGAKE